MSLLTANKTGVLFPSIYSYYNLQASEKNTILMNKTFRKHRKAIYGALQATPSIIRQKWKRSWKRM